MLERVFAPRGPFYVFKVEAWGFGIRFPGQPKELERDWEWDINRLIGAIYYINSKPPGRRFNSREEAEAWIREDKKTYPKEKFSWQPESKARSWLRDRTAEEAQAEIDEMIAEKKHLDEQRAQELMRRREHDTRQ